MKAIRLAQYLRASSALYQLAQRSVISLPPTRRSSAAPSSSPVVASVNLISVVISPILGITAEAELGKIYNGKVVKTAEFGAFVNFLGAKDGLVHISELSNERVNKTTDLVKDGDAVKVKVIGFDERGKVKLSMRVVDQATGADITEQVGARRPRAEGEEGERPRREDGDRPRRDRGDRPRREFRD